MLSICNSKNESTRTIWARLSVVAFCILLSGCAQGRSPFQTAGTRQADPYAVPNARGAQGPLARALRSIRPQSNNISNLYRRAQQQEQLAAQQQVELARLRQLQQRYDQLLNGIQQREQQDAVQDQKLLAQRAKQATQRANTLQGQFKELDGRTRKLDADNQDLQTRLARSQREYQSLKEQNELLRQRLQSTVDQLSATYGVAQESQQRVKALQASTRRRGGAQITANNSMRRSLTAVTVDGLEIRQSGELVRILLPSDQLFQPGTANLMQGAQSRIDAVAQVIQEHYPNQIIGVEAHADNGSVAGTLWRNQHQLTSAQALSVFDQLSYRNRMMPQQLFVLGHGANHPLVSNGTQAGQTRNRRVEIVVYPETLSNRS